MIGVFGAPGKVPVKVDVAPPLDVRIAPDSTGVLSPERDSAIVTGTIECSRASRVYARLDLERSVGDREIRGSAFLRLDCSGADPWSAEVSTKMDSLIPGLYRARVSAIAIDSETGRYALVEKEDLLVLRPQPMARIREASGKARLSACPYLIYASGLPALPEYGFRPPASSGARTPVRRLTRGSGRTASRSGL